MVPSLESVQKGEGRVVCKDSKVQRALDTQGATRSHSWYRPPLGLGLDYIERGVTRENEKSTGASGSHRMCWKPLMGMRQGDKGSQAVLWKQH